jgi:hypothetical protein
VGWISRIANLKTHFTLHVHSKTRTLAISTSLRYMGKLWHNILKDEMVHHNQVYYQGKVARHFDARLFVVILKKPYYISNTKRERIFNTRTSTTPSSLRKDIREPTN